MKKTISTLAIAGIGAALAVGAQAQTITGTGGGGSYAVTFAAVAPMVSPGVYDYTYTVSSLTNTTGGPITSIVFSGFTGFINATSTNFGGATPIVTTSLGATSVAFDNGVLKDGGPSVASRFDLFSTIAPGGQIGVVGSANVAGGSVNKGGLTLGPGAVPEAGSFALLGLGLLPLALVARRRISSRN